MLFISNRYIVPIFTSTRKFLKSANITFMRCNGIPFDSAQGDNKRVDFPSQEGSVLSLARIPISYRYIFLFLISLISNIVVFSQDNAKSGITEAEKQWIINKTLDSFVFVEGGTFMMGDVGYTDSNGVHQSFAGDRECQPAHAVTLDSYSIQKYEVTYQEMDLFTRNTNQELVYAKYRGDESTAQDLAAVGMTWYQAQDYCEWLGELIGYDMSLPTEAQWEYAARSRGKAVAHATDNGKRDSGRNVSGPQHPWYGTPPGTFPPNPLGMYDMSGNKPEWTYNWNSVYTDKEENNPRGPESGINKIVRGYHDLYGSVYRRGKRKPDNTGDGITLRCVCNSTKPVLIKPIK